MTTSQPFSNSAASPCRRLYEEWRKKLNLPDFRHRQPRWQVRSGTHRLGGGQARDLLARRERLGTDHVQHGPNRGHRNDGAGFREWPTGLFSDDGTDGCQPVPPANTTPASGRQGETKTALGKRLPAGRRDLDALTLTERGFPDCRAWTFRQPYAAKRQADRLLHPPGAEDQAFQGCRPKIEDVENPAGRPAPGQP